MNSYLDHRVDLTSFRMKIRMGAIAFLFIAIVWGFFQPKQFFSSYLFGFVFWMGIALGSLGIVMMHQLTGGKWGAVIRRILEAATRTLPFLAILFIPILLGIGFLYKWSDAKEVLQHAVLQKKHAYLNPFFFIIRSAIYFAIWIFLAARLNRWSLHQDQSDDAAMSSKMERLSAPGLILYAFTMSFAAFDWLMSLNPEWYSTIYGLLVVTGQMLSGFAFAVVVVAFLAEFEPFSTTMPPETLQDLGTLLFTFVMLWAYLAFSQFLIIWSGDLPDEIRWYIPRGEHWSVLAVLILFLHFVIPFLVLLLRVVKKKPRAIAKVGLLILAARLLDDFWLTAPDLHKGFAIHPLDFLLPAGLGCLWLYLFLGNLDQRPLMPLNDPNFVNHAENA